MLEEHFLKREGDEGYQSVKCQTGFGEAFIDWMMVGKIRKKCNDETEYRYGAH